MQAHIDAYDPDLLPQQDSFHIGLLTCSLDQQANVVFTCCGQRKDRVDDPSVHLSGKAAFDGSKKLDMHGLVLYVDVLLLPVQADGLCTEFRRLVSYFCLPDQCLFMDHFKLPDNMDDDIAVCQIEAIVIIQQFIQNMHKGSAG